MPEVIRPDGGVVTYEVNGSGEPVLLLAPTGTSSSMAGWDSYFVDPRSLADEFTVVSMDQRFAGAGRAPLKPFSHEEAIADQLSVLDALGLQDAFVIGADLAGSSALKLACDAPAKTRAVVLIEPMGLIGVACGALLGQLAQSISEIAFAYHVYPLRFQLKRPVFMVLITAIGGVAMQVVTMPSLPQEIAFRIGVLGAVADLLWIVTFRSNVRA